MSQASGFSRGVPEDAQSVLSVQTTQTGQTAQTTQSAGLQKETINVQQQSSSQVERSGRGERQRIQRSSSSASTNSSVSGGGAAAAAASGSRVEGPVGTGLYQQNSAEGANAYGASNGSLGSGVSGERRQGRFRRQVIQLPDQPSGQVRQVRRRLPTPEPDTLERVYIQRTGNEVVEEITEIPTTPPPRVQERTVVEPAGPPQVVKRTVRVPPRGGAYGGYQQQQQQQQQQGFGYPATNLSNAGSYSNVQQGAGSYQQQGFSGYQQQTGASFAGGFGAGPVPQTGASFAGGFAAGPAPQTGASFAGGFGAGPTPQKATIYTGTFGPGGGLPQPSGPVTSAVSFIVDGSSSQVLPPPGCQPAFCFYVN